MTNMNFRAIFFFDNKNFYFMMTEPFATLKSLYLDQTQSVMKLKLAH